MLDASKIKKRLECEFGNVKTFFTMDIQHPIFLACNFNDDSFMVVSVFMESEVGGHFSIEDPNVTMEEMFTDFTELQANAARTTIIGRIEDGDAEIIGKPDYKDLN